MTLAELMQRSESLRRRAAELKERGATFAELVDLQLQINQLKADKEQLEMEMLRSQTHGPVQ